METLQMLWPTITGAVIVPLTAWLKKLIPADVPIAPATISMILNSLAVFGINYGLSLGLEGQAMILFALGGQFTSQLVHAAAKTKRKVSGG